ncbi:hypothetical protein [Microbulbifer epialgicus]|uniref:Uncharacterized protein n=1 Tax=Microbulbifer epialgicus TaxID=393907 RepID=A0ABV4NUT2_9GAMM
MLKSKSVSATQLMSALNEANQEIGELRSDLKKKDAKIKTLEVDVSSKKMRIKELEAKLDCQSKVVEDTLGLNLARMEPKGNNSYFTDKSLSLIKFIFKNLICETISNLSADKLAEDKIYKVYMNKMPGYIDSTPYEEQPKEVMNQIQFLVAGVKAFIRS